MFQMVQQHSTEWIFLAGLRYQDFNNCGKYVFRTKIGGFACVCRTAPEYSELQTSALRVCDIV